MHICMYTHIHINIHTHIHTHTHKRTHTHTCTHAHTEKNLIHYNVTLQVPVKQIFTKSPSSSVRTALTMMYPLENTSDYIDPMEITTN